MRLLAIDPGNDAGWSLWSDFTLIACGMGNGYEALVGCRGIALALLIERPEFYEKDDPRKVKDLITLSVNLGRRLERAHSFFSVTNTYGVKPKTWKGGASKEAHHAQVKKQMPTAAVQIGEMVAKKIGAKAHNMWDAVALGFWGMQRMQIGVLLASTDYVWQPLK